MDLFVLVLLENEERRQAVQQRNAWRRNLRDSTNPFEMREVDFQSLFRLSRDLAREVIARVRNDLEPQRRHGLSVQLQVLTALRFLGQGSYQLGVGQDSALNISQSSVSNCARRVCVAVIRRLSGKVCFPQTNAARFAIQRREVVGFPGVLGCVDCTHIALVTPTEHEEAYVNHHGYHSLNVQMICDEKLMILNVCARYPGSVHDQFIWNFCGIKAEMERLHTERIGSYCLLGDSGYRAEPYMLTPIVHAAEGTAEYRYTQRHMSVRNRVERLFGVLKARWRCLRRDRVLHYQPNQASRIVNTCAILHNMMLEARMPLPAVEEENEEDRAPAAAVQRIDDREDGRAFRQAIVNRYFN